MNYKLQIHFLNDVTMWRTHVATLINMNTIKSPYLHQCRLHSNGNGFKVVQKGFIKSSRGIPPWLHMSTLSPWFDEANLYLVLSSIANCFHWLDTIKLMKWRVSLKLVNLKNIYSSNTDKLAST